jgi:hypothetical protein
LKKRDSQRTISLWFPHRVNSCFSSVSLLWSRRDGSTCAAAGAVGRGAILRGGQPADDASSSVSPAPRCSSRRPACSACTAARRSRRAASGCTCCRWSCGVGQAGGGARRCLLGRCCLGVGWLARGAAHVYSSMYCSAVNWSSCSPSSRRISFWMPVCRDAGRGPSLQMGAARHGAWLERTDAAAAIGQTLNEAAGRPWRAAWPAGMPAQSCLAAPHLHLQPPVIQLDGLLVCHGRWRPRAAQHHAREARPRRVTGVESAAGSDVREAPREPPDERGD